MSDLSIAILRITDTLNETGHISLTPSILEYIPPKFSLIHELTGIEECTRAFTQLCSKSFTAIILDLDVAVPPILNARLFETVFSNLNQLQRQAKNCIPVIFVLGDNDAELAVKAIKAGAAEYFVRSRITAQQLIDELEAVALSVSARRNLTDTVKEQVSVALYPHNRYFPTHRKASVINQPLALEQTITKSPVQPVIKQTIPEHNPIKNRAGKQRSIRQEAVEFKSIAALDNTPQRFIGTLLDITERKQAEATLRESEERLQLAIEGAGGALWDWNLLENDHLSPAWLQMLGYDQEELPKQLCSWETLIHPDDRSPVMEAFEAHLRDGSIPFQFEYRMLTKSGEWKWIADYGKVVKRNQVGDPIQVAGIHLDISDRKQAEEQLRVSEARYRTLANAVSQLMWVNSADGRIEFFNQQWMHYTGVEQLELGVGLWADIINPEDFDQAAATRMEAIQENRAYEVEVRLKRRDGEYRWHLARILPSKNEQGEVLNWFGTATDIHDRKCAEAEREHLLQQEQAARAAAERANRMKDEFLAILSHELRSPLNPILGWTQLLKTQQLDAAKTAKALETIERNARLQTQLIDDLLDIARILRGKLKLDNAPVSLRSTVEAAIETVKTAVTAKSITLETKVEEIGQAWGDAARLQQIVWNLLSNAIKFTPAYGQVFLQLKRVGDQGQITITDTGKGIRPEFLPHIFESFRQEDVSITRSYGGLGLGLAIVRYLVEAHGGAIAASSAGEGRGATFVVTLPLLSSQRQPQNRHEQATKDCALAGIRILAIDDERDSRDFLATLLSQYGAEVIVVNSARDALEQFMDQRPSLVISDLGMPNMDGYELLRKIRALSTEREEPIPAIALTAHTRAEDQQRTLTNGFQRHLPKPIEVETLIQTIVELVTPKVPSRDLIR